MKRATSRPVEPPASPAPESSGKAPESELHFALEQLPALRFAESGWCEELQRSYFRGVFRPGNRREYEALRPFAAEEL